VTAPPVRLDVVTTDGLGEADLIALRAMFDSAWNDEDAFNDDDWDHAIGGTHFLMRWPDGSVLSHASVVDRTLETGARSLRTGYVEGVATWAEHRGRGFASRVMRAAGSFIDEHHDLGALGTGLFSFYERLGWERWLGPTGVRTDEGMVRTSDEDGYVMVRRTPTTPALDLEALITCDWRHGNVW
jgi:aminoglycoside 2'-N-acetyltransferase I